MLPRLKRLLERRAPQVVDAYRAIHHRRIFRRQFAALHARVRNQVFGTTDISVLSGPFQGMRYFDEVVWGPITPKWLGSYECELHPVVEEIIASKPATVIDVGCAEGYYAVGLACRIAAARVYAYDTDFISRRQTRRLATLNGVADRIHVGGFCTADEIRRRTGHVTVLICDIEGFERVLLDPVACPALAGVHVLVEVHENGASPTLRETLRSRFTTSHSIRELVAVDRTTWGRAPTIDVVLKLPEADIREAVDERRTERQHWLWMKPHRLPNCEP